MQAHGNVFNRLDEAKKPVIPTVGIGATISMFSDWRAATIIIVGADNSVQVQEDTSIRTDSNGRSGSQSYRYEPNIWAPIRYFTLRNNGRYVERGLAMNSGTVLIIGERSSYHDYGF